VYQLRAKKHATPQSKEWKVFKSFKIHIFIKFYQ